MMPLEITSHRMLTELFAVSMARSVRIAVSASGGIGKSVAAQAFAEGHPGCVTIWQATKKVKYCPALVDMLGANLSDENKPRAARSRRTRSLTTLARYLRTQTGAPERFLVIVDDAQHIDTRALKQIVSDVERVGKILGVGLVLLGDEHLSLPSNRAISSSRGKALDAADAALELGPTMTTRVLTGEDVMLIAKACGASPIEADNLRYLHEDGRIDPTFAHIRRHLARSRRSVRGARAVPPEPGRDPATAPLC